MTYNKDDKANGKAFDLDTHIYCQDFYLFIYSKDFARILFNWVLYIVDHKLNKHKDCSSMEVYLYNLKA